MEWQTTKENILLTREEERSEGLVLLPRPINWPYWPQDVTSSGSVSVQCSDSSCSEDCKGNDLEEDLREIKDIDALKIVSPEIEDIDALINALPQLPLPDATNPEVLDEIFAEVLQQAKERAMKNSIANFTTNEYKSFFTNILLRINTHPEDKEKDFVPTGDELIGLKKYTYGGIQEFFSAQMQMTGLAMNISGEINYKQFQNFLKMTGATANRTEAQMRSEFWETIVFKQSRQFQDFTVAKFVSKESETRMQTVKVLLNSAATNQSLQIGTRRQLAAAGTVTRYPTRVYLPIESSQEIHEIPDLQLKKRNYYIFFDITYALVDRHFLTRDDQDKAREDPQAFLDELNTLPLARVFKNLNPEMLRCAPYLLIEVKPFGPNLDVLWEKALAYLVLNASVLLSEWLKLFWLGAISNKFVVPNGLVIHMFAAVGHSVRHYFSRIRPLKDLEERVRYETVLLREYDLDRWERREPFNMLLGEIHGSAEFYGNMYKKAIRDAMLHGKVGGAEFTDSDRIYFTHSKRSLSGPETYFTLIEGEEEIKVRELGESFEYNQELFGLKDEQGLEEFDWTDELA